MEEDDDDDDNDYDYIEDKLLLSANTTAVGSSSQANVAASANINGGSLSTASQSEAGATQQAATGQGKQQSQALQNLLNGDSADKSVKKQRVWKKDMLRQDDFSKMREMVTRLRKHRQNEAKSAGGQEGLGSASTAAAGKGGAKSIPARTSIQQT